MLLSLSLSLSLCVWCVCGVCVCVCVRECGQDQEEATRLLRSSAADLEHSCSSKHSQHHNFASKNQSPPVVHAVHERMSNFLSAQGAPESLALPTTATSSESLRTPATCSPERLSLHGFTAIPLPPAEVLDAIELFLRPSTRKVPVKSGQPCTSASVTSERQPAQVSFGDARFSPGMDELEFERLPRKSGLQHSNEILPLKSGLKSGLKHSNDMTAATVKSTLASMYLGPHNVRGGGGGGGSGGGGVMLAALSPG